METTWEIYANGMQICEMDENKTYNIKTIRTDDGYELTILQETPNATDNSGQDK
jgi:hypothetical protein